MNSEHRHRMNLIEDIIKLFELLDRIVVDEYGRETKAVVLDFISRETAEEYLDLAHDIRKGIFHLKSTVP